jgi:hypothetical protein
VSIVGVDLLGKENYHNDQERLSIIGCSMIFGMEFMLEILHLPNLHKIQRFLYGQIKIRNHICLTLIVAFVNEESIHQIKSIKTIWGALRKLKDLYDSHSELEIIQLQIQLFKFELKDNDLMAIAFKIKAIMYNPDVVGVEIHISLTNFIKALYPIYSHYLESLQASG